MRRLLNGLVACALLLFGTIPCQAMTSPTPPKQIALIEELLAWYGGLSGDAFQECTVTQPIVSTGEVFFGATSGRVDIVFLSGLRVSAGTQLTIDNPNLVLMGPPPAITVEPGGVLHIKRWHPLAAQAMPQGSIVVQAGGRLVMETGVILPDGVVIDQNPPPNKLPPPTSPPSNQLPPPIPEAPEPEIPDGTPPPEVPDETPSPETPPPEEKLSIKGEVLKVTVDRVLFALVTLPSVDPALTETIGIERSADAQAWNTEYIFRWDEDALGFSSDEATEFGSILGRTRSDGNKTDFQYLARLSGEPFYLRVSIARTDGRKIVSDAIQLNEPPVGQYLGSDDYDDSGGNRGGGGQGTTGREEQKETAGSRPDNTATAKPQIKTQISAGTASVGAPPVFTTVPQEAVPAPQSIAEQVVQGTPEQQIVQGAPGQRTSIVPEEALLPTSAHPPEQTEQAVSAQRKPMGSSARNWLIIAATLALCGTIWIFTIKRKKS